jgi:hypothetical protein
MTKIEMFKEKFKVLVNLYEEDYKGEQPILSISSDNVVSIKKEFIHYLPEDVRSSLLLLIEATNDDVSF